MLRGRLSLLFALVLLPGLNGGCSNGGSSTAIETGTVAVLITDGPADGYESIFITLNHVALLPADGGDPVTLFTSETGEEIDILLLRNEDFLLTIEDDVPAGLYIGVQLQITDARTEGGECDELEVRVPGGKIKVKSSEPFSVAPDRALTVRVDVDANKSIHLHPAGNSGMCILRPVIHGTFASEELPDEPCLRAVSGTIDELLLDDDGELIALVLDLGPDRGTLEVAFGEDLSLFDDAGFPAESDGLEVDQEIGVRGTLNHGDNLVAQVLFLGKGTEVSGTIASVSEDGFVLTSEADEGAEPESIDIVVVMGTLVLADCEVSGPGALIVGADAEVLGFVDDEAGELRAYVVSVGPAEFDGMLTSVTEVSEGLEIEVLPENSDEPRTLQVPAGTDITFEQDGPVSLELIEALLECEGLPVTVTLDPEDGDVAIAVELNGTDFEGAVESVDADAGEIVLGETTVNVQPGATLLALTTDEQEELALEDLEEDDRVRVFGLESCEEDVFEAFVVLRLPGELPEPDGEGCGPGYWKQPHHFDSWPDGIRSDDLFADHFEDAFPGKTLLAVLKQGGGRLIALGRHTVAAFLNNASEDIDDDFEFDDGDGDDDDDGIPGKDVIDAFDDVFPGSGDDHAALKDTFEDLNERHCPLN